MDTQTVLLCLFIFIARIADVSIGTIRTISVINGRRGLAWLLGFCEVTVWVLAVSSVLQHLQKPAVVVAYALGFATGNYLGMTIERWIGFGEQVVRIFTRAGRAVADRLRDAGFPATEFDGMGRDGPISLVFVQTRRRSVDDVTALARETDTDCYYTVEDIRKAHSSVSRMRPLSAGQPGAPRK